MKKSRIILFILALVYNLDKKTLAKMNAELGKTEETSAIPSEEI